jgi:hypothetical protein
VERVAPAGFVNAGSGREGVTPAGFENATSAVISGALDQSIADFTLSSEGSGPAPEPQPEAPTYVGAVGRGRTRVWVEIRNGQVYEASDEQEARKVVRAIKRRVTREMRQRPETPPVEVPEIVVRGAPEIVESLRREIAEVQTDWAAVYRKLWEDADEDDVEALLL